MIKRVLIISPYFPPSNAADMHRVRMSLPYFKNFDWEAEVVCVDEIYSDVIKDNLLLKSLPADLIIHKVKAYSKKWSKKIGFGSLGFRSAYYYKTKVNKLLIEKQFNLIYFSTTQFPLCVLGPYWKKKFKVPYVIDMQDPWYSNYYDDKPKNERPPKYKLVYAVHKKLEAIAMRNVSGLISVSENYLQILNLRYPNTISLPSSVITFGAFEQDFEIAICNSLVMPERMSQNENFINCVYVGRGGHDMEKAIRVIFEGFKMGLSKSYSNFEKLRFHFLGTSYAPDGEGKQSICPIAKALGVEQYVTEQTDRIPFYDSIKTLLNADILMIPGSDSPGYTASKIYPYIMAQKPLLAVFHKDSSVVKTLKECSPASHVVTFSEQATDGVCETYKAFEAMITHRPSKNLYNKSEFEKFSAKEITRRQVALFNSVLAAPCEN